MTESGHLSLSWDAHQKSICHGLSLLQQRGEFVDMTLAADGHHVKVHQMVLSLVSPYIKDLISTAQCPHPVIFLNDISYTTLCAILEYIYTGEVLVPQHQLPDVIAAGKALHIRGLKEMGENETADPVTATNLSPQRTKSISEKLRALRGKKNSTQLNKRKETPPVPICKIYLDETAHDDSAMEILDSTMDLQEKSNALGTVNKISNSSNEPSDAKLDLTPEGTKKTLLCQKVQYSVSNHGGLQVIYNRYLYQLRYIKRNHSVSWRCIDYNKNRCSASIITNENDDVVERIFRHNHPFHDKGIVRKLHVGMVYSKYQEAAGASLSKKIHLATSKNKEPIKKKEINS